MVDAPSLKDVRQALTLLVEPGAAVELRVPHTRRGTASGYFSDLEKLAQAATQLSGTAPGVYFTLNPIDARLLFRARDRVVDHARHTTADDDVPRRRWCPIDFDPRRPSGISSTDAEHAAALERARACLSWLRERGCPATSLVLADSGNGGHILVRIDLPNDPSARSLLARVLQAVAFQFDDDQVSVDQKTGNAGRVWKLYGTLAAKGENLPERPHRPARILEAPSTAVPVGLDILEQIAALAPTTDRASNANDRGREKFDLERWIADRGLPVLRTGPWNGGCRWILSPCPWNLEHQDGAAYIVQHASGAVAAGCHHSSCTGKGWHDLRDLFEPGWRNRRGGGATAPDSRSLEEGEDGNGGGSPLRIWERPEPPPREYVVDDLIPAGALTILYGDGGLGKSLLALYVATCTAAGSTASGAR